MGFSVILNDFLKGLDSISLIASVFSGQLRSLLQFGVSLGCCPEQTIEELWDFFLAVTRTGVVPSPKSATGWELGTGIESYNGLGWKES